MTNSINLVFKEKLKSYSKESVQELFIKSLSVIEELKTDFSSFLKEEYAFSDEKTDSLKKADFFLKQVERSFMQTMKKEGKKKGLAALSPEKRKEICSMGGKAAHARGVAHRFNSQEAKEAIKRRIELRNSH